MVKLFGTDGVRGEAGSFISVEMAVELAKATSIVIAKEKNRKLKAIIGNDSRISGYFLTAAVSAGLASVGVNVTDVGVISTPGLAYLTVYSKLI
jgi:phosphoglucosamine mutase